MLPFSIVQCSDGMVQASRVPLARRSMESEALTAGSVASFGVA